MGVCPLLPSPFLWPALKDTQYAAKLWIMACGRDQWRRKGISQFWWASTKIGDDQVFVWKLSPQPDMIVCRTETLSVKQFLSHWMQKLGTMLPTCYICYGRVKQDELATTTCHHPDTIHTACRAKWGVNCPLCRQPDPLFRPVARMIPFEEIWYHGRHWDSLLIDWARRRRIVPFSEQLD